MPLESVTVVPQHEDYTPLSEHQAQTPATFFGSRPVLHCHAPGAKLAVRRSEYESNEILRQIEVSPRTEDEGILLDVDAWITSKNVILFSKTATKGFSIDYPTVALHALGSQGGQAAVYLQLDLHDKELTNDDDDIQTLTLNLIPQATTSTVENGATNGHAEGGDTNGASAPNSSAAKALFEALSACADLNPDPMDEDDEDEGGVDMLEPGAGGWITSENMHEFMDENGNWTGPQIPMLGAGAGQVRSREEADGEDAAEGANSEDEETKWRRTG